MPHGQTQSFSRSGRFMILGLGGCLLVLALVWWKASDGVPPIDPLPVLTATPKALTLDTETESAISAFCGDCHAQPRPESFARSQWYAEVRWGYKAYARSGRSDLTVPSMQDTLAYYQSRAPEDLQFPAPAPIDSQLRSSFTREPLDWGQGTYVLPAVSHLRWGAIGMGEEPRLLACDMRDGSVSTVDINGSDHRRVVLARFDHPCHAEPCDLDGDGRLDLVVAELGSLYPSDHDRGRVIWLRKQKDSDSFSAITVAEGLGRVADVRPTDVDGDGDQDLIVAVFGNFLTGSIALLRNVAESGEAPHFLLEEIDPRPGTIHVPVHDFNDDGRPDFLALVSQEYEAVDMFLNQGNGEFRFQNLWAGPDLTFGSTGIELVDLDRDGDMDVLYSNGDTFDNSCASPTHGIQWLENIGDTKFSYHRLVDLPGAYRALPADFDADGDLDVIAVAFLPARVKPANVRTPATTSILFLEHRSPGEFTPHPLECGFANHATFETGDFDADGDVDFVVGNFLFPHEVMPGAPSPGRLTVWWNDRIATRR